MDWIGLSLLCLCESLPVDRSTGPMQSKSDTVLNPEHCSFSLKVGGRGKALIEIDLLSTCMVLISSLSGAQ
jgi:hypothetical protein